MNTTYEFNYTDETGAVVVSTGRSSTKNGYYWKIERSNGSRYPLRARLQQILKAHPPDSGTVRVITEIPTEGKPLRMSKTIDINIFLLDNDLNT